MWGQLTMEMAFEKLDGLGNDFVFLDGLEQPVDLSPDQARRLCDRHTGIGADGVIVVRPSDQPGCAAYMHYINADGTLAQMCGNGVRCFAKYLVDHGIVDPGAGQLVAGTLAGPRAIGFTLGEDGLMDEATVSMGRPILRPSEVPVSAEADALSPAGEPYVGSLRLESPFGTFAFACISMGNPHAICFIDDWDALPDGLFDGPKGLASFDVASVGAFFEAHEAFPEKANIEFAEGVPDGLRMRVYERGCGETMACGTGACASVVAGALTGRCGRSAQVHLPGGTLRIAWEDDGEVRMTGPATRRFTGTIGV